MLWLSLTIFTYILKEEQCSSLQIFQGKAVLKTLTTLHKLVSDWNELLKDPLDFDLENK